jgi:hypothetical protein
MIQSEVQVPPQNKPNPTQLRQNGLSPEFIIDLKAVYESTAFQIPAAFLADLEVVHQHTTATPAPGDTSPQNFGVLADRLQAWRDRTHELVSPWRASLPDDDPLLCPVTLFGTMDLGRLETAHTRSLAWLLNPTKEHGFGNTLIEALLARVTEGPPRPIKVHSMEYEYPIILPGHRNKGRLDVMAKGKWEDGNRARWGRNDGIRIRPPRQLSP